MKANWSCTACGMYSGRRYCVQRHIDNINIHNGKAMAIPFVEYLVGRREGWYPPAGRPSFGSQKHRTLEEKMEEEVQNLFAQRVAESSLPPAGDRAYHPEVIKLIKQIKDRQCMSDWGEFLEILEFLQKFETKRAEHHGRTYDVYNLEGFKEILGNVLMNRKPNVQQT